MFKIIDINNNNIMVDNLKLIEKSKYFENFNNFNNMKKSVKLNFNINIIENIINYINTNTIKYNDLIEFYKIADYLEITELLNILNIKIIQNINIYTYPYFLNINNNKISKYLDIFKKQKNKQQIVLINKNTKEIYYYINTKFKLLEKEYNFLNLEEYKNLKLDKILDSKYYIYIYDNESYIYAYSKLTHKIKNIYNYEYKKDIKNSPAGYGKYIQYIINNNILYSICGKKFKWYNHSLNKWIKLKEILYEWRGNKLISINNNIYYIEHSLYKYNFKENIWIMIEQYFLNIPKLLNVIPFEYKNKLCCFFESGRIYEDIQYFKIYDLINKKQKNICEYEEYYFRNIITKRNILFLFENNELYHNFKYIKYPSNINKNNYILTKISLIYFI
jgi:hypothetical protein